VGRRTLTTRTFNSTRKRGKWVPGLQRWCPYVPGSKVAYFPRKAQDNEGRTKKKERETKLPKAFGGNEKKTGGSPDSQNLGRLYRSPTTK